MTAQSDGQRGPTGVARRRRVSPLTIGITLTFAMAMGNLTQFTLGALGPILIDDLGLSPVQLGTLSSAYFAVGVVLSARMGAMVDRFGGRTMLVVLFGCSAAALAGMAASPGFGWLVAASAGAAVPLAISNPATNQLVAAAVPRGRQGVLLGAKQSGVQVSAAVAGGVLPTAALLVGWRTVLLVVAAVALTGVALSRWTLPAAPRRAQGKPANGSDRRQPRLVRWLTAYAALMGASLAAIITYLPLYGTQAVGLSVPAAGATAALIGAVGIPSRILWARYAERSGRIRGPLLTMSAIAAVATAAVLAAPLLPALIWLGAAALGASAGSWLAVVTLTVVRDVATATAGRASGIVLTGFYLGMVSSPVAVGWTITATGGYNVAWLLVVLTTLASGGLVAAWARQDPHEDGLRGSSRPAGERREASGGRTGA